MEDAPAPLRRLLVAYAPAHAFAPMARPILARMGYHIVPAEEVPLLEGAMARRAPDLLLVDERHLDRVPPTPADAGVLPPPILLLVGRRDAPDRDARVVGAVRKPAGLHDLYRVMQQVLEETPRTTPRVATQIAGRCLRGEQEWKCAVLSLSENGCLVRTESPLPLGSQVQLALELPDVGCVETEAEAAYQLVSDIGLVFHATPPGVRHAISSYVSRQLLER